MAKDCEPKIGLELVVQLHSQTAQTLPDDPGLGRCTQTGGGEGVKN